MIGGSGSIKVGINRTGLCGFNVQCRDDLLELRRRFGNRWAPYRQLDCYHYRCYHYHYNYHHHHHHYFLIPRPLQQAKLAKLAHTYKPTQIGKVIWLPVSQGGKLRLMVSVASRFSQFSRARRRGRSVTEAIAAAFGSLASYEATVWAKQCRWWQSSLPYIVSLCVF